MRIALLTNGPGELWGWARPVITELRKRGHSISLWLLPCQFASGAERIVASRMGVDKLEGPGSGAWTWQALSQEKTDCVVQLGGDLLFGRRIAKCASVPLICYAYGLKKGMEHAQVFTAYAAMASKIPDARVIGDLVKDSLELETGTFQWEDGEGPRLLLFPGSRQAIRRLSLGWLLSIVASLKNLVPKVQVGTLFSPFVSDNELPIWRDAGLNPLKVGAAAAMKAADYALTQPGTNTFEMLHCGLPALVAAPIDFLKVIPVSGLSGFAASIPLLGPRLKAQGIRRKLERYGGFVAWPNRIANQMLMDEAVGDVNPAQLAQIVAASLNDSEKRVRVRNDLLALSGDAGATLRLCDAVEKAM